MANRITIGQQEETPAVNAILDANNRLKGVTLDPVSGENIDSYTGLSVQELANTVDLGTYLDDRDRNRVDDPRAQVFNIGKQGVPFEEYARDSKTVKRKADYYITDPDAVKLNYDGVLQAFAGNFSSGNPDHLVDQYDEVLFDKAKGVTANVWLHDNSIVDAYGYNNNAFNNYIRKGTVTSESVSEAAGFLNDKIAAGESLDSALSSWYGADITIGAAKDMNNARNLYGASTGKELGEFSAIASSIMRLTVPFVMATNATKDYTEAYIDAYNKDPMLRAVFESYGITPTRATDDGSQYLYDPISGGNIRTWEQKDTSALDVFGAVLKTVVIGAAGGAIGGALLGGATGKAVGSGVASAGFTAAEGGDTADIIVSGVLAGAGSYAGSTSEAAKAANDAVDAAIKAGASTGEIANLTATATNLSDTAKLANTLSKTGNALDALANKDYLGALSSGLSAAGLPNPQDYIADQLVGYLDPKGTGHVGVLDSGPLSQAAGKLSVSLMQGNDYQSALSASVRTYIKEGGSLAVSLGDINLDLPDSSFLGQFDTASLKAIEDALRKAGSLVDDTVLEPLRKVGSVIDDEISKPILDLVEAGANKIAEAGKPIEDLIKDALDSVPDVDLPDMPDFDTPNVNLPWDKILGMLTGAGIANAAGTVAAPDKAKLSKGPKVRAPKYAGKSDILQAEVKSDVEDSLTGTSTRPSGNTDDNDNTDENPIFRKARKARTARKTRG